MKHRRVWALLLAVLAVFCSIPLSVSGENEEWTAQTAGLALNFALSGDQDPVTVSGTELLQAFGIQATAAEKLYFEEQGIRFRVSDRVPGSCISVERSTDGLTVQAKSYGYTAENGITVWWIPRSATVNGNTVSFENGKYEAHFAALEKGKVYEARVEYKAELSLDAGIGQGLSDLGYTVGTQVADRRSAYETDLKRYNEGLARYNADLAAYLKDKKNYEDYLVLQRNYLAEKEAYDRYLREKQDYEEKLALYEAYLQAEEAYEKEWAQYEEQSEEYKRQYEAYVQTEALVNACASCITAMESVFIVDSTGRSMYKTLVGGTVDTVVQNKEQLLSYGGVDENDVDNAGNATVALIRLTNGYKAQGTDGEKFRYYKENYEEIRDQFILLYSSLFSLCKNPAVRSYLNKKGKLERYYQFIAQLYVISTGLDDQTTFDAEWNLREHTVFQVAEEVQLFPDRNNADPAELTYPETVPPEPVKPVKPTAPEKVEKPVKSWTEELVEPVEPEKVEEPKAPADKETYTGSEPKMPVFTEGEEALEKEVRQGTLGKRAVQEGCTLDFYSSVSKAVSYSGAATARFFDADRKTLLYSQTIPKGEEISYGGAIPSKSGDKQFTYRFSGWVDEEGNAVQPGVLERDTDFYASYEALAVDYTVTFRTHTGSQTVKAHYGDLPQCSLSLDSYRENGYEYVFSGWTPALTAVEGDREYTALYTRKSVDYVVTFKVGDREISGVYATGEMPQAPEVADYRDSRYFYCFEGWSEELKPVSGDEEYVARFRKESLATDLTTGESIPVEEREGILAVGKGSMSNGYRISTLLALAEKEGKAIRFCFEGLSLQVSVEELPKDLSAVALKKEQEQFSFHMENPEGESVFPKKGLSVVLCGELTEGEIRIFGTNAQVETEQTGEGIALRLEENASYRVERKYSVTGADAENGRIVLDVRAAFPGEKVTGRASADLGFVIEALSLQTGFGEITVLPKEDGSFEFEMPQSDVTAQAAFRQAKYLVRFLDEDGTELSRGVYSYGEKVVLPETPEKEEKGGVTYVFAGWSPVLEEAVTKNADYRAVFKAGTKGEVDTTYSSPYDSSRFFSRVVLPALGMLFGIVGALTAAVIAVRKKHKHKKD